MCCGSGYDGRWGRAPSGRTTLADHRTGCPADQTTQEPTHVPAILDKILRIGEGKILRQLDAVSRAVNAIEDDFVAMSDAELRGQTAEFRERLEAGETPHDLMAEAFATVRGAAKRVIGQRAHGLRVTGGA